MMSSLVTLAKSAKHAAFVAWKHGRVRAREVSLDAGTALYPALTRRRAYEFRPERYRRSFLLRTSPVLDGESLFTPRIFTFWTGDNDMSSTRQANFLRIAEITGLPTVLVTPDNLDEWVVPGHPLHSSYSRLSFVHRSDYLRAYFLHHHGGGYCDIKEPTTSWQAAADRFVQDPSCWYASYPLTHLSWVARVPGALGRDLQVHFSKIVGNTAAFARSKTPFTAEWLREVERRLDYWAPQLAEFSGGARGETVGYPISGNAMLNQVHHPLCLKYQDRLRAEPDMLLGTVDYQ